MPDYCITQPFVKLTLFFSTSGHFLKREGVKDTKFEGENYNDFLCPYMVAIEFFRSFEIGPRKEQIPKSFLSFDVSDLNPPGLTSFLFSCKT